MNLLILGGAGFLGPQVAEQALEAGDRVTWLQSRKHPPASPPGAEVVLGDRDQAAGFDGLRGRRFDACIDLDASRPEQVDSAAQALGDSVASYALLSSVGVYADLSRSGLDERALTRADSAPATTDTPQAQQAWAERRADEGFGERAWIVRAGLIAGPHDPTGRFTWWVERALRGGEIVCPGPALQSLQWIDVRDVAGFLLDGVRREQRGIVNACGPERTGTFADLIQACRRRARLNTRVAWIDPGFLLEAGVQPWTELPLWIPEEGDRGLLQIDNRQALAQGLNLRPLEATVDSLVEAIRTGQAPVPAGVGLKAEREQQLLHRWKREALVAPRLLEGLEI